MKVTELRIGNWVLYEGKPFKVAGLLEDGGLYLSGKYGKIYASNIQPIPLDEETSAEAVGLPIPGPISYVHELQNLYFVIMKKEMKITADHIKAICK